METVSVKPVQFLTTGQRIEFYTRALALLVKEAEMNGVILTVERRPQLPLAMGNHGPYLQAWIAAPLRKQLEAAHVASTH